jgi:hypothetical protein
VSGRQSTFEEIVPPSMSEVMLAQLPEPFIFVLASWVTFYLIRAAYFKIRKIPLLISVRIALFYFVIAAGFSGVNAIIWFLAENDVDCFTISPGASLYYLWLTLIQPAGVCYVMNKFENKSPITANFCLEKKAANLVFSLLGSILAISIYHAYLPRISDRCPPGGITKLTPSELIIEEGAHD